MTDLDKLFFPGVDPEFFPDTEVLPEEWRLYEPDGTSCAFCERRHDQVPRLVISGAGNGAICSDCVEELAAILRGPEAYDASYEERRRKFKKEIGDNPNRRG